MPVSLGGLNETVEASGGTGTVGRVREEPVVAADDERADGALRGVVIDGDAAILKRNGGKAAKANLLLTENGDRSEYRFARSLMLTTPCPTPS